MLRSAMCVWDRWCSVETTTNRLVTSFSVKIFDDYWLIFVLLRGHLITEKQIGVLLCILQLTEWVLLTSLLGGKPYFPDSKKCRIPYFVVNFLNFTIAHRTTTPHSHFSTYFNTTHHSDSLNFTSLQCTTLHFPALSSPSLPISVFRNNLWNESILAKEKLKILCFLANSAIAHLCVSHHYSSFSPFALFTTTLHF